MIKKPARAFLLLAIIGFTNVLADIDGCLGNNFYLYGTDDNTALREKIKVISPSIKLEDKHVLAILPSGTCDTVDAGETLVGRRYYKSTIIDENKFTSSVKSLAEIVKKCKNQKLENYFRTNNNPYGSVGTCVFASNHPLVASRSNVFQLFQPLSATSALYENSSNEIILYKDKEGTPTYLSGIIKATGVYQYNSNGGLQIVPEWNDPQTVDTF